MPIIRVMPRTSASRRRLGTVAAVIAGWLIALPAIVAAQTFDKSKEGQIWQGLAPMGISVTRIAACTAQPYSSTGITVCNATECSDPTVPRASCTDPTPVPRPTRPRLNELDQPYGVAVLDPGPTPNLAPGAQDNARLGKYQIFVADHRGNRVVSFDYNGNPIRRYGSTTDSRNPDGTATVGVDRDYPPGQLLQPMGLAVDGVSRTLLVGGYNGHLDAFDTDTGNHKWTMLMPFSDPTVPGWSSRQMVADVSIAPGTVVSPTFDKNGDVDCTTTPTPPDTGRIAVALWPADDDPWLPAPGVSEQQVVVYDSRFCKVGTLGLPRPSLYNSNGDVDAFNEHPLGPGYLYAPTGVHIERFQTGVDALGQPEFDYRVIVVDTFNKIEAFTSQAVESPLLGHKVPVASLVGQPGAQDPGNIQYPFFMTTDSRGRWFVGDTSNQRIAVYTPDYSAGTVTYEFEFKAAGNLVGNPRGVAIDQAGRIFGVVVGLSATAAARDFVQPFDTPAIGVFDVAVSQPIVQRGQIFDFTYSLVVPDLKPTVIDAEPVLSWDPAVLKMVGNPPAVTPRLDPLQAVPHTTQFQVLDTAPVPGTTTLTVNARGTPTDVAGEYAANGYPKTKDVGTCDDCETIPPTITGVVTAGTKPAGTNVYITPIQITLSATDLLTGGSRIQSIYWQYTEGPGANATPQLHSLSPTAEPAVLVLDLAISGSSKLEFWAVDGNGNTSSVGVLGVTIEIDSEPPTLRFTVPPPVSRSPDGWWWWTAPVTVTATMRDNKTAPEALTFVKGGPESLFTEDGRKQGQDVWVQDQAGNVAEASTTFVDRGGRDVNIDRLPPVTVVDKTAGLYQDGTTILLTATDAVPPPPAACAMLNPAGVVDPTLCAAASGAKTIYYTLSQCDSPVNGACPESPATDQSAQVQTAPILLPPGTTIVSFYSQDWAGNKEGAQALTYVVNRAPVGTPDTVTMPEDTPVTIDVLANDVDPDNDPMSVTAVTEPANGTAVIVNNQVLYTPKANDFGSDTFNYTVADDRGGNRVVAVSLSITSVNDAPVAVDDTLAATEDTPVTYAAAQLLANDTDVDTAPAALRISAVTSGTGGTAVLNGDGTVTVTPAADFNGAATFTYTVTDGADTSSTATVTVDVATIDDPPVAKDDALVLDEDTSASVNVLANDTDADGDTLTVASFTLPANGTVTFSGGGATYRPNANFNGTDSFTYAVTDPGGATSTATVTVTVRPVNDLPIAADFTVTTPEDTPLTGIAPLGHVSDIDGDVVSLTAVGTPAHGTAAIVGQTVTYTPVKDFSGTDMFTYTVNDGHDGAAVATVTVSVTPMNDPPVAANDTASVVQGQTVVVRVLANDTDVDGNALSVTAVVSTPEHGTVTLNGDGTISYAAGAGFVGTDSFTYTIDDGHGGTATATVGVTITSANASPDCKDAYARPGQIWPPNHKRTYEISILGVTDPDLDPLTLTVTGIYQDEPTNTMSDGNTWIDGDGVGTSRPWVRAERMGGKDHNGRVYEIRFKAEDAKGAACEGKVFVGVPHDQGQRNGAVDDGVRFDSTVAGAPVGYSDHDKK